MFETDFEIKNNLLKYTNFKLKKFEIEIERGKLCFDCLKWNWNENKPIQLFEIEIERENYPLSGSRLGQVKTGH